MKRFKAAKDIRVGVVGYGGAFNMGRNHLQQCRKAGMTPTAVAEIDPARLAAAEADWPGIATFGSLQEMLRGADVNLVVIITPHNTHADLVLEALRAGRHVVCEKPLAVTTRECDRMLDAAAKNDVILSAYHNRHWDGCILRATREIAKGVIGEVTRIEAHMGAHAQPGDWWRSSKTISGGILYDWGVHLLEYGLQILRADLAEVSGYATTGVWADATPWGADTNEDEATAVVRFADGRWLSLRITSLDANPKPGQLEITGTKGTYIFDHRTWKTIVPKGKRVVTTEGVNPPDAWQRYYDNIAAHLVGGEELVITGGWSCRPIHILDLACRSAEQGRAQRAKYA